MADDGRHGLGQPLLDRATELDVAPSSGVLSNKDQGRPRDGETLDGVGGVLRLDGPDGAAFAPRCERVEQRAASAAAEEDQAHGFAGVGGHAKRIPGGRG
ncbi:hypothetical protein ACFL09_01940 [Planctomycetota bacterium]